MLKTVLTYITNIIAYPLQWFGSIFDAVPGLWELFLSFFAIALVTRFLLKPIFGSALSDAVTGPKNRSSSED